MKRNPKKLLTWLLLCSLLLGNLSFLPAQAKEKEDKAVHLDASEYGVDPTGEKDSTEAVQKALAAAKKEEEKGQKVVLEFPRGEYQIYKDKAEVRNYHTSNTNSLEHPQKTIGILIEEHKNLTIDGNGSLFMMHGNMMALAVVKSENIKLKNFSWDFEVPTVSEMTITNMGSENGSDYTDFYIPDCFPYIIEGNSIKWTSEKSPYTDQYYWTETNIHRSYAVVAHSPGEEMTRNYWTDGRGNPFSNVRSITQLPDGVVRISYAGARPDMQTLGMVFELASSAVRETAGAFTWESKNVDAEGLNVHFMHGFGWLIQMSTDVSYRNCNFMPRKNSGHITVSYADIIHASGAAGKITIEGCNFSNSHDDPINLHGTFTRVERRKDDHTLVLKYIHQQQGGFPQYHEGDKVAFFTRDFLQPPTGQSDEENLYTVEKVLSEPTDTDGRTMEIKFKEALPEDLADQIGWEPKYVAENVTYAPSVYIKNNTFKNVPTRGILCTTRNKVVIEGNKFLNMSMATIFLSNDSNEWYESGPIRDMTIKNNEFYIKSIGRTAWDYAPAVYVHPVTKGGRLPGEDTPIHKNITIDGNTFHMDVDTVVYAESVENLTFTNNKILRTNPNISIELSSGSDSGQMKVGETLALTTTKDGDKHEREQDNAFEFTSCKNVTLKGNTYDDGLKKYAVLHNMSTDNIHNEDTDIQVIENDRRQPVSDPVSTVYYASSAPEIISVDHSGVLTANKSGTADIYAYYIWDGTIVKSNVLTLTADGEGSVPDSIKIQEPQTNVLNRLTETLDLNTDADSSGSVRWSVLDFQSGNPSDIATIDENGVMTPKQNGIVWVRASAGTKYDQIPVIVSLPEVAGIAPGFTMYNPDPSHYTLGKDSLNITMQKGDLYQSDNSVKNLLLYRGSFDRNNVCTTVKVDNLPINEGGQWDTASFLLFNNADNYISVGKKSHKAGIASVEERNGTASEYDGDAAQNAVSSAYLGFMKQDDTLTLAYKTDGEWQTVKTFDDASFLGSWFSIGFAAWHTNDRGKDVTFSDFKVGTADQGFDAVSAGTALSIGEFTNTAPTVSDLRFDGNDHKVGEEVSVDYTFADADYNREGATLYQWSYEEDKATKEIVTTQKKFRPTTAGTLTCTVYPVDEHGTPGKEPKSVSTEIGKGTLDLSLDLLQANGVNLLKDGKQDYELLIPADLAKVTLDYRALMSGEGKTKVSLNKDEVSKTNADSLILDVADKDVITLTRSGDSAEDITYTIAVKTVESNLTQIQKIEMPEAGLSVDTFDQNGYTTATKAAGSSLLITADKNLIGHVEVKCGAYRKDVPLTETETGYQASVSFEDGLNNYYVQVYGKDGITMTQHILNVIYLSDFVPDKPEVFFTQTIKETEHGTITSSIDGEEIPYGASVTYTFAADEGYHLEKAMVNGKEVTIEEDGTYTIDSVLKDLTIEAVFAKDKTPEPESFTQTIKKSEHGTITSSIDGDKIPAGSSVTYTFTPDKGYHVEKAMVNGKDATLKEDGTYTIESVSKDLTIEAVFAKDKTPEPEKPGKPKPEQPGTPNKPGKPNKPAGQSKPGSSSSENTAAKTGDPSPVVPFICLLGLSAAAAGMAYYRKKQK